MNSLLESGVSQVLPVTLGLCYCLTYLRMTEFQYPGNTVALPSLAEDRAECNSHTSMHHGCGTSLN